MAKKAVFVNMGFDPTATLEIISATSLSSNDLLVLVYPRTTDDISRLRNEQARTQIKNYVNALKTTGRGIELREIELELSDTSSDIDELLGILMDLKRRGFYVYFELTGGVRAITVTMCLLSVWFPNLVDELTYVIEVTRVRKSIPVISPAQLSSKTVLSVLSFLAEKRQAKRKDISEALDVSESRVSRIVSFLKKLGIVEERLRVISLNDRFAHYTPIFKNLKNILQSDERILSNLQDKKD
ncbi:MAG: ArsR family transcriptional regulator [Nitrososphaerota archaeon]